MIHGTAMNTYIMKLERSDEGRHAGMMHASVYRHDVPHDAHGTGHQLAYLRHMIAMRSR